MKLNLRQAITSAMVGGIAAALASLVLHHGVFGASQFTFAAILGASRPDRSSTRWSRAAPM
jgi:hypothetical protein